MKTTSAITKLVQISDDGYVAGIRCAKGHGGNTRLAGPVSGYYECCGCGGFWSVDHVLGIQRGSIHGQQGQGGIYRVS